MDGGETETRWCDADEAMKQTQGLWAEMERDVEPAKELEVSDTEDVENQGHADLPTACRGDVTESQTPREDLSSPNSGGAVFHHPAHPLKEETLHMMEDALSHTGSASVSHLARNKSLRQDFDSEFEDSDIELDPDGLYPHQQIESTSQHCFLIQSHTEEVLESPGCVTLSDHHKRLSQDKDNPLSFQNAMETLRDIRQAYQDAERGSRGGSSLPSLRDNRNRRWNRVDPAPFLSPRSSHVPVPPKHRQRTQSEVAASQSLPGLLPVTESGQLSQSAPSVLEPLSSDIMLQARAHVQSRLGSHSAVNDQKGLLSALHPRTPKLLAPLDRRPVLPGLKQKVPLKPISPLSSMTRLRRERLSWGIKGGSEESGSSSSSTQSSMDMEDEDEEDDGHIQGSSEIDVGNLSKDRLLRRLKDRSFTETDLVGDTKLHFMVQSETEHIPPLLRSASELLCIEKLSDCEHDESAIINDAKQDGTMDDIKHSMKINIEVTLGAKEENHNVASASEPDAEITPENRSKIINEEAEDMRVHKRVLEKAKDAVMKPSTAVAKTHQLISAAHVDLKRGERMGKGLKPGQSKERRNSENCELRAKNPNNQDRSLVGQNKSKRNRTFSAEVKDKVKAKAAPSPGKKAIYHPQKTRAQQHIAHSACHSKSLSAAATARSKSAADFITYTDMFQQIQSGDEGPAIYEMFAGPLYDNLRVSSSCERTRGPASCEPLSRRTQRTHKLKHRPLKQPASKRRSPKETTVVPPKHKAKRASSTATPRVTSLLRTGSSNENHLPKLDTELVPSKHIQLCSDNSRENPEDHTLSTIEEALSKYGFDTLKSDEKPLTRPKTDSHTHTKIQETPRNLSTNLNRTVPESVLHQSQLMINTWTSSSCNTIMSPVYQRFLDEAGDGPLTDDLLQCLAEELISLDERDVSITPHSDALKSSKQNSNREGSGWDEVPEVASGDNIVRLGSGLDVDDTITWTKGEVLGRGAYGTVYCGLTSQGQLIAVKQVSLDASDPAAAAQREYNRLQEEVELLKALRHANIVGFLGTSLHQHVVSIFMEYIPGGSIASILHRFGPLPERVLALYTHQIVEGVAYLHLNRVIHRDLKGNNVMLMPTGVIKLIDFGCARRLSCLNHTAGGSGDLLRSVHGTPYWMAPEVISETGYGRKSDIWSVGCTVFEMATGKPPLANMDKMAAMFYIGAKRGLMPSLPDGFSENAKDFVKTCLTSNQRLRPSAGQLLKHSFISKHDGAGNSWETHKKNRCSHSGRCC
ncbi:uncharacterized protein map3k19 isoform X2 [Betta splendens]|uniref:Mitogen-activated protein kinase kinase kinase 19 n=1 Tax=Betta splendens TaxID=158456 RepID=A0A6P7LAV5_BETSP|nr:uncharacterized protein map3k19 isoform X2 [Betta splendens]